MRRPVLLLLLLTSACDALPRDPGDTSGRIASTKVFTVGFLEPDLGGRPQVTGLLKELERRTGAHAHTVPGGGEVLLTRLQAGDLDLAIGRLSKDSPWKSDVALAPPLAASGPEDDPIAIRAAARNGENRWIMTVERASRAVTGTQQQP